MNWELLNSNRNKVNRLFKLIALWRYAFIKYQNDPDYRIKVLNKIEKMQAGLWN